MIELIKSLERLVEDELVRARREHDASFNSSNEALGVLLEEIDEVAVEVDDLAESFDAFKKSVYADDDERQVLTAGRIYSSAIRGCAELIQVSAMAKKAIARAKKEK